MNRSSCSHEATWCTQVAFFVSEGRRLKPVTGMRQAVSNRGLFFKFLSETQKSRDAIEYRVRLYLSKVSTF